MNHYIFIGILVYVRHFIFLGLVETFEKVFSVIPSFRNFRKLSFGGGGGISNPSFLRVLNLMNQEMEIRESDNLTDWGNAVSETWFPSEAKIRLPNAAFQM